MVAAVGRAAVPVMPRSHAPGAEYTLEGLLLCQVCGGAMEPAPRVDGTRAYSCAPGCSRGDLVAAHVESSAELHALIRATVTLCPDLDRVNYVDTATGTIGWGWQQPRAEAEELRRFQQCDLTDLRALVRAAFVRIEVDHNGEIRPVRRGAS